MEDSGGLVDVLQKFFGGAGATIVGAMAGRLMWHVGEVRKRNRKFFGSELAWELPVAFGMGLIGDGVADWFELSSAAAVGVIVALSYLGPRAIEAVMNRVSKG